MPAAIANLRRIYREGDHRQLAADLSFLGLRDRETAGEVSLTYIGSGAMDINTSSRISDLIKQIDLARAAKDYETADRIRRDLSESGVKIANTSVGSSFSLTDDFNADRLFGIDTTPPGEKKDA